MHYVFDFREENKIIMTAELTINNIGGVVINCAQYMSLCKVLPHMIIRIVESLVLALLLLTKE